MKRLVKLVLVAVPALVLTGVVGLTTTGCDDDSATSTPVYDLSVTPSKDMAQAQHD